MIFDFFSEMKPYIGTFNRFIKGNIVNIFGVFLSARIWSRERCSSSLSLYTTFLVTSLIFPSIIYVIVPVKSFELNFFANLNPISLHLFSDEIISTISFKGFLDFFEGVVKIQSSLFNLVSFFFTPFERLITGDCLGEDFFLERRRIQKVIIINIIRKYFTIFNNISYGVKKYIIFLGVKANNLMSLNFLILTL